MKQIKEGIFQVGALNPAMRVFDIVMTTDYGTSYNSYLVKGSAKTALVDVCHKSFYSVYLQNIREVCDPKTIDYIVLNHNEPDHTGALAKLLPELREDVEIYTSQAGSIYIKAITNRQDLKLHVVKEGETLDLGGKTLKFVLAPFLHWPDSMFTAVPEDRVVFTCDFLGSHYAEPYLFDTNMAYPEKYRKAFLGYYQAIFGPFKKYVLAGLQKLEGLDFDMVLPSHGPVLTKGCMMEEAIASYREWSTPVPRARKRVPVFYTSAYGNTRQLAEAVARGILSKVNADVPIYDIIDHPMETMHQELNESDAFAVGTPTINRDAVPPVWGLLAGMDAVGCQKKPCVVFGSFGWSGEGVPNVAARLASLKCSLAADPLRVTFVPTKEDLAKAEELGASLAEALQ
jgi:flavorubredoxin